MALIVEIVEPAGDGKSDASVCAVPDAVLAKLQSANMQATIFKPHRFGIFPPLQTEVELLEARYHHINR